MRMHLVLIFGTFILCSTARADQSLMGVIGGLTNVGLGSSPCGSRPAIDAQSTTISSAFPFDLARHACMFDQDFLITGASISAGVGVSPISILAEASVPMGQRSNISRAGSSSRSQIDRILASNAEPGSTVFAIDLFFWDAARPGDCNGSISNAKRLIEWADRKRVNLILGNIPFRGSCADRLNREIATCALKKYCFKVDALAKQDELTSKGYLEMGGEKFTESDLRPDRLHFSRNGAVLFAEEISKAIDKKPLNCAR